MKRIALLTALLAAACVEPDDNLTSTTQALTPSADCAAPEAVPNDGIDDRQAIQDRLDLQGCVRLGSGDYFVGVDPGSGQSHIASLHLRGGMSLSGAGPATRLIFTGSPGGDWRGVRLYGSSNVLSDVYLDGTQLVTADEQTHMVEVVGNSTFGPADHNMVRDLSIDYPYLGTIRGDCLRVLGEAAYQVTETLVDRIQFVHCKRSAVAIQRGVYNLTVQNSTVLDVTDQPFDGEQSGGGTAGPHNGRIALVGNLIFDPGKYAIAMSGAETADLVIANNVLVGGGISCRSCPRTSITGNTILHSAPGSADATVSIARDTGPVTMTGNTIVRMPGTAGPVIGVVADGALQPTDVTISGNPITQMTSGVGINVVSARGVSITGNPIRLATGATGPHAIKFSRPSTADPLNEDVAVIGNTLLGAWQIGLTLQSTTGATVGLNSLRATGAKGLSCSGSTAVMSAGNNWTASTCSVATAGGI